MTGAELNVDVEGELNSSLAQDVAAMYESPELVELGLATTLMKGIVYTKYYQDCGENGTTDYRPTC